MTRTTTGSIQALPAPGPGSAPAALPGPAAEGEARARRRELAAFLRSRRERITPEQVGLVRGRRRRTPGLRREEVAQLAAVGVTWYTWLEQGRDIQVSPQVLDAVARALLLDPSERTHLFRLGGAVDPAPGTLCPSITPAVRALLEQLEPVAACVQNGRYDILAYNRVFGRLLCDLDTVPPEDRNCMILALTHEGWRSSLTQLDGTVRAMAAKFRASMADHLAEPAWRAMLARLMESPQFREVWERHEVLAPRSRTKHFRNAEVGPLRVVHTDLWLGPADGPRLVTYVPADEESRRGLEQLLRLAREEEERGSERGRETVPVAA